MSAEVSGCVWIRVLGVAQVPGTVQGVQAGHGQAGRVADVVQPCRGVQEISVRAENTCQAACPSGDALDMRPAAGEGLLQECLADVRPMRPGRSCGPASRRGTLRRRPGYPAAHQALRHIGAPPVDGDDQAALAQQHRGAPHGVVGHPEVAG
jgi:hypothetical protein